MASIAFSILPFLPLAIWFVLVGWSPGRTEGEVLVRVPVPLLARLKMLWLPLAMGLVLLTVGIALGRAPWSLLLVVPAVYAVALVFPVSYTLTTVGIRTGRGVFRRWTEFAGVRRSRSGAVLQGGPRASSYPIYLSGGRDDDDFVRILRIFIRDSYKGKSITRETLSGQSDDESSSTSSMSH